MYFKLASVLSVELCLASTGTHTKYFGVSVPGTVSWRHPELDGANSCGGRGPSTIFVEVGRERARESELGVADA